MNFESTSNIIYEENKDLTKKSTLNLKASGHLYTVKNLEGLIELIKSFHQKGIHYRVLGLGANQVLPETSEVPYIKLDFSFDKDILKEVSNSYVLPASLPLNQLTSHAIRFELSGWEVFTGIPATLGGAVAMNAGTNLGEIGDLVKRVKIVDKFGKLKEIETTKEGFKYRGNHFLNDGDVLYEVELIHNGVKPGIAQKIKDYLLMRNNTQPLGDRTCGCMFKNYKESGENESVSCPAGKFLDIMGLKGFTLGGVQISHVHANFLINKGGATKVEVQRLVNLVKDELKLQFGKDFELEVKL